MRQCDKRIIISIGAFIFALPVIFTVVLSFWNKEVTLACWNSLFFDCFIFYPMFWNSIIYSVVITIVQLIVTIPCAFGMVMAKCKWKKVVFWMDLCLMMLPLQATILPNYIGLRELNLLNTRTGIIVPMIFSVFGIIVMYQYIKKMDIDTIEAARLETSSIIQILMRVVIPEKKVCIFAVALFIFADSFNMLEQPMLFLNNDHLRTLAVFIPNAVEYEGNVLFPAAVIYMIPVLLLYLLFGKNLEECMLMQTGKKAGKL